MRLFPSLLSRDQVHLRLPTIPAHLVQVRARQNTCVSVSVIGIAARTSPVVDSLGYVGVLAPKAPIVKQFFSLFSLKYFLSSLCIGIPQLPLLIIHNFVFIFNIPFEFFL